MYTKLFEGDEKTISKVAKILGYANKDYVIRKIKAKTPYQEWQDEQAGVDSQEEYVYLLKVSLKDYLEDLMTVSKILPDKYWGTKGFKVYSLDGAQKWRAGFCLSAYERQKFKEPIIAFLGSEDNIKVIANHLSSNGIESTMKDNKLYVATKDWVEAMIRGGFVCQMRDFNIVAVQLSMERLDSDLLFAKYSASKDDFEKEAE